MVNMRSTISHCSCTATGIQNKNTEVGSLILVTFMPYIQLHTYKELFSLLQEVYKNLTPKIAQDYYKYVKYVTNVNFFFHHKIMIRPNDVVNSKVKINNSRDIRMVDRGQIMCASALLVQCTIACNNNCIHMMSIV